MMTVKPAINEMHAAQCELAAEVLHSSGRLRLQVMGWSMLPTIWPGDTLIVEHASVSEVSPGDIVLFGRGRRLFAHRIVGTDRSGKSTMLTRGDAMPTTDSPIGESELLGKVSFIVRNGKYIRPRATLHVVERAVACLVQRSEFAARVVVGVHGLLQTSFQTA